MGACSYVRGYTWLTQVFGMVPAYVELSTREGNGTRFRMGNALTYAETGDIVVLPDCLPQCQRGD